jgi:malate dehydrogenase (oxaloacetate-decarboxylating)(NADP+)
VLRAVQTVVDEGLAQPVLIGRAAEIEAAIKRRPAPARGVDYTLVEPKPASTPRCRARACWQRGRGRRPDLRHAGQLRQPPGHVQNEIGLAPGAGCWPR